MNIIIASKKVLAYFWGHETASSQRLDRREAANRSNTKPLIWRMWPDGPAQMTKTKATQPLEQEVSDL